VKVLTRRRRTSRTDMRNHPAHANARGKPSRPEPRRSLRRLTEASRRELWGPENTTTSFLGANLRRKGDLANGILHLGTLVVNG